MLREIEGFAAAGADGVVVGAIDRKRRVDSAALAEMVAAARPMAVTFHRAFDHTLDLVEALEVARGSGGGPRVDQRWGAHGLGRP